MSVSKLCEGLAERSKIKAQSSKLESGKFNLEIFTTTANGRNELDVEDKKPILLDGVPVIYFRRLTKDHSHFSPGLLLGLNRKLKVKRRKLKAEPLIVHIHAWWNLVSVLSCLVAKWYDVPVILSPRGMLTTYSQNNGSSFSKKILQRLVGNRLLRYCHIHATSEREKQDVLRITQPKSITVIPNLVDVKGADKLKAESLKTKMQSAIHNSIFKLLFLSRIDEKKGLTLLLEALETLNIPYHLTIAGSGDEDYINSLKLKAESLKLDDRINWLGQVSNEEKFSVMADHDLLILPSYNENFANVVIECLSVGTPVLVSKSVGLADYVKANDLGWICSLEPKNIAAKITEAYTDLNKREKIKSIAPTIIKKDFDDKVLVERYLKLYEDVLQLGSNTKNSQPKIR